MAEPSLGSSGLQAVSEPAKASRPVEKPSCRNCGKDIVKHLMCGQCKAVEYCSAKCQKDDWPYHKRNCKKPEEQKEEKERPSPPRPSEKKESKARGEDVVKDDDEDEKLSWYRHREWKPTAEPKKEFTPTAIAADRAAELASQEASSPPKAGSAWNKAGTWEERDVTSMALRTFREQLEGLPSIDAAGGAIEVMSVDDVEGEASKPVIRGKMRHLFDLSFKLKVLFKWMD